MLLYIKQCDSIKLCAMKRTFFILVFFYVLIISLTLSAHW